MSASEDLIDFPCSDTWLGYYHERGLTPRKPRSDERRFIEETKLLREAIIGQTKAIYKLIREIRNEPKKDYHPNSSFSSKNSFLEER